MGKRLISQQRIFAPEEGKAELPGWREREKMRGILYWKGKMPRPTNRAGRRRIRRSAEAIGGTRTPSRP